MNIFIELPTWLGDTVMATPSIEEIVKLYPNAKITLFGSFISTESLKSHPNVVHIEIDKSKKSTFRYYWLFKMAKRLYSFDLAISFRSSFSSKLLLSFIKANKRIQYKKNRFSGHQVEKYANTLHVKPNDLKLYQKPYNFNRPTLGINPGATYGSAKRWYPKEFAKVANHFSNEYDIVIFGGPNEIEIAKEVEKLIQTKVTNLAGKTNITELIEKIAGLDLFVTNDSGPMHIAAAYKVPTVAIFGPTKYDETSPWNNPNATLLSHDLECAPCMKRVCPLKHHNCMKEIKADEVIKVLENHLSLGK